MTDAVDVSTGLTVARLRETLDYDPATGNFTWSASLKRKGIKRGSQAGCLRQDGSWQIRLDGHLYRAHRLACLYMTGKWPAEEIDHINRNANDNRWVNLREANRTQNEVNKLLRNQTGYACVQKSNGRFRAKARIDGISTHLGMADTAEEAHAIAAAARRKMYGDFAVSQIGEG